MSAGGQPHLAEVILSRRTMRRKRLLRLLMLSATLWLCVRPVHAAPEEEWKFILAIASSDWDVRRGTAKLERSGSSLKGRFIDSAGVEYQFNATISGSRATGRVVIVGSDSGGFDMSGTYTRRTFDVRPCLWQTIQLYDGFHFFSLLRTEDRCKP